MYICVHIYTCIHIIYIHEKHLHTHKYTKPVFFGNPPTCRHGHSASCIYKCIHIHENTRAHTYRNQYFLWYPTAAAIELILVNFYMHIPANTCAHTHTYMGTSIYWGIHPPAAGAIQSRICTHVYTYTQIPMHTPQPSRRQTVESTKNTSSYICVHMCICISLICVYVLQCMYTNVYT